MDIRRIVIGSVLAGGIGVAGLNGAGIAGALPGIMEAVSRLAGAEAGAAAEAATVAGAAGKLLNTLELPEALPRLP